MVHTNENKMAKRLALYFAGVGYVLAVWYYASEFRPVPWTIVKAILGLGCPYCILSGADTAFGVNWEVVITAAPLNALICGIIGFLVGIAVRTIRRQRVSNGQGIS